MEAYAIFEGGGAKGYAHIGALKAAEERGIVFRKVAGTSAGAIIAALAAAGYTADELLNPEKPVGERGILEIDPEDLLDAYEYGRIVRIQQTVGRFRGTQALRNSRLAPLLARFAKSPWAIVLAQLALLIRYEHDIGVAFNDFGMTGTAGLETWLEARLRAKVKGPGAAITFGDLKMKLRVVAANLRTGIVHEFGGPEDRDRPVAPAVAASACFPVFFRPVEIGGDMFVDGGLVSNLPAWIFDGEREDDPTFRPTFGFRLVDDPLASVEATPPVTMPQFVQRVVQTLVSGDRNLEERRIQDYYGIDLTAAISTLSFAELKAKAPLLVTEGGNCVRRFFQDKIGPQDPIRMSLVLKALVGELRAEYDEWRLDARIRASVLLPQPDGRWAQTTYSVNMENDADDRLRVRLSGLGAGACFVRREPVYIQRPRVDIRAQGVNKYETAARPGDIRYIYAIPIFDDPAEWSKRRTSLRALPFAALVIDKSEPINSLLLDENQQDVFANAATIVGEEVRGRSLVPGLHSVRRPNVQPKGAQQLDKAGAFLVSKRKDRDISDTPFGLRLSQTIGRIS